MKLATFALSEFGAFGDDFEWRLKENEIRFRGRGHYANLVLRRIPASDEQIADFKAAVDLLEVRTWRSNYDPHDLGYAVDDGVGWTFTAEWDGTSCRCGGSNAYPAFVSPQNTSMSEQRYRLLKAALFDAFRIEGFIKEARRFAEREAKSAQPDDDRR